MKAKELAEILLQQPNSIVVAASDEEGNSYSEIHDVSTNYNYDKKNREIGFRKLTKELKDQGYEQGDTLKGAPCFVIWP